MNRKPIKLSLSTRIKAGILGAAVGVMGDRATSTEAFKCAFLGQWEGWEQNRFRERPGRRTAAEDTDLNYGIRELLISEARSLEQTYPVAKRIANKFADNCVGKCKVKWDTGNPAHDAAYRLNWENFKWRCDVNGEHTFPKLAKLAVASTIRDGDIFTQKVNVSNYLQLRMIEADRVSSSGVFNADLFGGEGPSMIGGIGLDDNGRPKFIRCWKRTNYGYFINPSEIPKKDFLHFYNSQRVDSYRSVTFYHTILNPLRDLKEANRAELLAIKRNSRLALLHKLVTGPLQKTLNLTGEDAPGQSINGVMVSQVDDATDAYMFPGEDMQAFTSARPGATWIDFMEFVIRQIAIGVDLPFGVLWHMSGMGKPAILVDLQAAQKTFNSWMDEFEAKWFRPIVAVETAMAIEAGRCPKNPNWTKFMLGRPAPITIDAGRDSAAALNENRMAMRSARSWFFESEEDWEEETEQCFKEQAYRNQMAEKYDVDINDVRLLTPNGNPGNPPEQTALLDDELPVKPAKKEKVAA